jgi:lysozyme
MAEPKPQSKVQPKQQETDPVKIATTLVVKNEGYKPKAYWDSIGKVWTIGTGITHYADGSPVKQGDTITKEQNDKELYNHLQKDHEFLKTRPAYNAMNPNQIGSTLDLTFNIGNNWTKERNASLLDATSSPEKLAQLPDAMRKYTKAKGQVVQGLVNRRERAIELFNQPYTPPPAQPTPVSAIPLSQLMIQGADGMPSLDTRPSNA